MYTYILFLNTFLLYSNIHSHRSAGAVSIAHITILLNKILFLLFNQVKYGIVWWYAMDAGSYTAISLIDENLVSFVWIVLQMWDNFKYTLHCYRHGKNFVNQTEYYFLFCYLYMKWLLSWRRVVIERHFFPLSLFFTFYYLY